MWAGGVLITLRKLLDNLHVSESELREIISGASGNTKIFFPTSDPTSIQYRIRAESLTINSTFPTITVNVPIGQCYIVYSAYLLNDSRAAQPMVRITPQDGGVFTWPLPPVAPATNRGGTICDAAFFPQVIAAGATIEIIDDNWVATDVITFGMYFTRVNVDSINI